MQYKVIVLSALASLAAADYSPDTSKLPNGNPIHTPLNQVVPGGKPFQITWTPTTPGKVSILLLKGPANNVQYLSTIAADTDNTGSYTWNVDPNLVPQDTGYAIQIISEDHSYQYSTQIGISNANVKAVGGDSTATSGAIETAPPSSGAEGTAVCGALDECDSSTSFGAVETAPPSSAAEGTAVCGALDECETTTIAAAATGTGNYSSPIVTPTVPMSVPTSLATVAAAGTQTSVAVIAQTAGSGSGSSGSAQTTSRVSSAFGSHNAQLSGLAALAAGLLGFLAL